MLNSNILIFEMIPVFDPLIINVFKVILILLDDGLNDSLMRLFKRLIMNLILLVQQNLSLINYAGLKLDGPWLLILHDHISHFKHQFVHIGISLKELHPILDIRSGFVDLQFLKLHNNPKKLSDSFQTYRFDLFSVNIDPHPWLSVFFVTDVINY